MIKNVGGNPQIIQKFPNKNVEKTEESNTENCELDIIEQAFKESGIDLSEYEEMYENLFNNN